MNQSVANFALLFVGACVCLAGIGLFFTVAEMDYHVSYIEERDTAPTREQTAYYDQLPPEQKQAFDGAKDGGVVTLDEDIGFPAVVKYQETYYVFSYYSTFDWLNLYTAGPTIASALGGAAVITAMRRDIRHRGVY